MCLRSWTRAFLKGKRLKEARLRSGLTQAQVGINAGMDQSVASARINQYERDVHVPGFGVAEQLAKALKVPAAYFYAVDDGLAAWILAYAKISASGRRSVLDEAGVDPRHL